MGSGTQLLEETCQASHDGTGERYRCDMRQFDFLPVSDSALFQSYISFVDKSEY